MCIIRSKALLLSTLLLVLAACSTSRPTSTSGIQHLSDNNVVTQHHGNTRYSRSKTDGASTIIFRGQNNIINLDISDSDVASFNSKTVTIVEGDNNNVSSTIRKCVLRYQGRTDTIVIKGKQLKIDFTADSLNELLEGPSRKEEISTGPGLRDFPYAAWSSARPADQTEQVFIEELDKSLPLPEAFRYYTQLAQGGSYQAFYMLGRFFDNLSFETVKDMPRAMEYYEMAARHNHAEAALRLAHIYEAGDFEFAQVPVDRVKAEYYYRLAAKNGSEAAQQKLAQWGK